MSGLSEERLAAIRSLANLQCGLDGYDADDLLIHVDHLTAENARLREGIEALLETVEGDDHTPDCGGEPTCGACWAADLDSLLHPNALLNPPTEGEVR